MNKSSEGRLSCLVSDPREKAFSLSQLCMLTVDILYMLFIKLMKFPYPNLPSFFFFFYEWMLNFDKCFCMI